MADMMKVQINGVVVDREVAHTTSAIQPDGSLVEYPEPLLHHNEVVFRPVGKNVPIIVARTQPA